METKRPALPKSHRQNVWVKSMGKVFTGKCRCCHLIDISVFNFHVGHVQAFSKGGTLEISNLLAICSSCNLSMGSKNLREFQELLGYPKNPPSWKNLWGYIKW